MNIKLQLFLSLTVSLSLSISLPHSLSLPHTLSHITYIACRGSAGGKLNLNLVSNCIVTKVGYEVTPIIALAWSRDWLLANQGSIYFLNWSVPVRENSAAPILMKLGQNSVWCLIRSEKFLVLKSLN
eukprot:sb/3475508/